MRARRRSGGSTVNGSGIGVGSGVGSGVGIGGGGEEAERRQVDGMQTLTRVSRGGCAFSELSPPTSPPCQATDSFHSAHT